MAVVLVLGLALAGSWWLPGTEPTRPQASSPTHSHVESPSNSATLEQGPAPVRVDLVGRAPGSQPRPALVPDTPAEVAARFSGRGRIEGFVDVPAGLSMPRTWTLVIAPSKVLIGGERAESRRIEFGAGETSFLVEDLALGGYDLRADAPGWSGEPLVLLLAKPDSQYVVVRLRLVPSAFVEGRVLDEDGQGVEGLPVLLVRAAETLEARTDFNGAYLFERVPSGEWTLFTGSAQAPLAAGRELVVSPPSVPMPDVEVPVLGELLVRVLDSGGQYVEGARLEGWGSNGGRVDGHTDPMGLLRARFLPPGRFTLTARGPEGRADLRARRWIDLERGASEELELELQPPE